MSKNLRKKLLQDAHVISRSLLAEGLCFHVEVVDGKKEAVNLSCWLVVWNMCYFPFHIWEWKIIPTDELTASFFRGLSKWFLINHQPDNLDTITNINQYSPTLSPAVNFSGVHPIPFSLSGDSGDLRAPRATQAYPAW
jgi:hypothetical protein